MRAGRRSRTPARRRTSPRTRDAPVGRDVDLGQRAEPLGEHPLARVAAGSCGTAGSSGRHRNTSSAAAPGRGAAGSRCRSRHRARAPALGGSATWRRTLRSVRPRAPSGHAPIRRFSERSHPASSSLPVAAARRVGHAAGHRGAGGVGVDRGVVRRPAHRGRGAAVARVGRRAARDARAASADAHRAARHRACVRGRARCRARSTARRRRSRLVGAVVATLRVRGARLGSRHRVGRRERAARTATSSASRSASRPRCSSARSPPPDCSWSPASSHRCCSSPTATSRSGGHASLVGAALVVLPRPLARLAVAPVGGAGARGLRGGRPADPRRPVLFLREHVRPPGPRPPARRRPALLDLRLGATPDRCRWASTRRSS